MCQLTDAIGDSDSENIERIVNEDCDLIQQAESCLIELEQFSESMKDRAKGEIVEEKSLEVKTESRLIDLQEQMQQLMMRQMQQQKEVIEHQEQRDYHEKNHVRLPKLELCTFNGNK